MFTKPCFFEKNRVYRVYKGGRLFSEFFGDGSTDGNFPEEWIASAVGALNKEKRGEKEGVSRIKDNGEFFDEVLRKYKYEMLGSSGRMRILVKILDSAVRLPAQAHPDKAFSRKYFGSEYGKTESWIILGKREGAKIYFGFKEGVNEEKFKEAIADSEWDKGSMERLMESMPVSVGEVYIVPAKAVHAIGAGCLILEVQEPTDFTVQPERWCDDYKLSDGEMYLGLSPEEAIGCFEFKEKPKAEVTPETISSNAAVKVESLISTAETDCFVINRISLTGGEYPISLNDTYGVYIVTEGEGEIRGENYEGQIKKGEYFFMPAASMGNYALFGNMEVIECY